MAEISPCSATMGSKSLTSTPEDDTTTFLNDSLTTLFGEPLIEDDEASSETRYGALVMRVAAQVSLQLSVHRRGVEAAICCIL